MFVKPLSGLGERSYAMRLAFRYANHRNDQEDKGRQLEKCAAQRAIGNGADHAKQGMNDKNADVESESLRCMKSHLALFTRYQKQLEQRHHEPDIKRGVGQHHCPLLRQSYAENWS